MRSNHTKINKQQSTHLYYDHLMGVPIKAPDIAMVNGTKDHVRIVRKIHKDGVPALSCGRRKRQGDKHDTKVSPTQKKMFCERKASSRSFPHPLLGGRVSASKMVVHLCSAARPHPRLKLSICFRMAIAEWGAQKQTQKQKKDT